MEKVFIKNRTGQAICAAVRIPQGTEIGLAIIMPGLGGTKEQTHVQTFAQAFLENDFRVIIFDPGNSSGESYGQYENATITTYYKDLEDVISWMKIQSWYREPFALAGHSLGAITVALYAEDHPQEILAVAPISTAISGEFSLKTDRYTPDSIKRWRESGWQERPGVSRPGVIRRLPWSHMEDRLKYNLLEKARKLNMPVLLITGENDMGATPEHHKLLFDKLPGKKELHIITGAPHTFAEPHHLSEIKTIFSNWIRNQVLTQ